ncbi:hypothetical protein MUK42_25027, partial [Musa troglodytarum]
MLGGQTRKTMHVGMSNSEQPKRAMVAVPHHAGNLFIRYSGNVLASDLLRYTLNLRFVLSDKTMGMDDAAVFFVGSAYDGLVLGCCFTRWSFVLLLMHCIIHGRICRAFY